MALFCTDVFTRSFQNYVVRVIVGKPRSLKRVATTHKRVRVRFVKGVIRSIPFRPFVLMFFYLRFSVKLVNEVDDLGWRSVKCISLSGVLDLTYFHVLVWLNCKTIWRGISIRIVTPLWRIVTDFFGAWY